MQWKNKTEDIHTQGRKAQRNTKLSVVVVRFIVTMYVLR